MQNQVPVLLELKSYEKDSVEHVKVHQSVRFWSPGTEREEREGGREGEKERVGRELQEL